MIWPLAGTLSPIERHLVSLLHCVRKENGLFNAGQISQRSMHQVFADMNFVVVFMDDICLPSVIIPAGILYTRTHDVRMIAEIQLHHQRCKKPFRTKTKLKTLPTSNYFPMSCNCVPFRHLWIAIEDSIHTSSTFILSCEIWYLGTWWTTQGSRSRPTNQRKQHSSVEINRWRTLHSWHNKVD